MNVATAASLPGPQMNFRLSKSLAVYRERFLVHSGDDPDLLRERRGDADHLRLHMRHLGRLVLEVQGEPVLGRKGGHGGRCYTG